MRHISVTLPELLLVTCDNLFLGYISSLQRNNDNNITCFWCYYLTLILGSVLCSISDTRVQETSPDEEQQDG